MNLNRQMVFALIQLGIVAPLLWRASGKEQSLYFKWGLRASAGAIVFANLYHGGKALQAVAKLARPSIPFTDVQVDLSPAGSRMPAGSVTEGEIIERRG